MPVLRLAEFGGMIPIMDEYLLPDNAAVVAQNTRGDSGGVLAGRTQGTLLTTVAAGTKHVFRIPTTTNITDITDESLWLPFTDADAKVVRSPNVNDSFKRIYWTAGTAGARYAPEKAFTQAGEPQADNYNLPWLTEYKLGVPAPGNSMGVDGEANSATYPNATYVTRAYLCTFINVFGEESPPSAPLETEGLNAGTWSVNSLPQPPAIEVLTAAKQAFIKYLRIYRTVTGTSGATTFFKVADIPVDAAWYTDDPPPIAYSYDFADNLTDSQVSGNVQITTDLNAPPPDGVKGLTMMPNGIMVAFKDNNVYFSEAYKPWSWPPGYTLTVEHPIVGLGVTGQTCVVCTTGFPAAVTGVRPDAMSLQKHAVALPCLSAGSIVSTPGGVMWATNDGLVMYANGVFAMTTDNIGRDKWQAYNPRSLRATLVGREYTGFHLSGKGFSLDPTVAAGVREQTVTGAGNLYLGTDVYSALPWVINGTAVQTYAPASPHFIGASYRWVSKLFRLESPANFSCFQAFFAPCPQSINDVEFTLAQATLQIKIYRNDANGQREQDTLVHTQTITAADHAKVFRLPAGFLASHWRFEFSGTAPLRQFVIATSIAELRIV